MDKGLFEILLRIRKYAPFFEWPDKKGKEVDIVENLLRSMQLEGETEYSNPISSYVDPPDCIISDRNGSLVGVEVTEFVSAEAIRRNERGDKVYRNWQLNEVIQKLNALILNKDAKEFQGGPYAKKILVIFTDEIILLASQEEYKKGLLGQFFGPVKQINEAYFLFSYDGIDRYPYIKLCLNRSDVSD